MHKINTHDVQVDMIHTACRNVTASQGLPTFRTDQIEATEVVSLAERMLLPVGAIDREEFRGNNGATILIRLSAHT